jgi:acetyltransferase
MGFPIAVKILSPDITHKSTVGGVALDLETPNEVRAAAQAMVRRLEAHRPGARLVGFSVQRMARRPNAAELIVGASTDPVFGPVILFGQGGIAVEAIGDRAIGLPPLNLNLARELVSRTRIARLLAGYRDRPPIDHDALYLALVQVSQLVCELPEIDELDINPLFADDEGVLALDARMAVTPADAAQVPRLAIRPYPAGLEERVTWGGHSLLLRPIRPEDEPRHGDFFRALTPEDIYFRFFNMIREPDHSQLARWTQIDYDREMAFVAIARDAEGRERILGEARVVADPDNQTAEFAIVVRSDLKERGLGTILFSKLIRYCRDRGTAELVGEALPSNARVIALARDFGFATRTALETGVVQLRLALRRQ